MLMIELFIVSNVILFFLKRFDYLVGNTLIVVLVLIKKLCFVFLLKSWRRGDFLVVWVAFINRRSSFFVVVEIYKVCGILRFLR